MLTRGNYQPLVTSLNSGDVRSVSFVSEIFTRDNFINKWTDITQA